MAQLTTNFTSATASGQFPIVNPTNCLVRDGENLTTILTGAATVSGTLILSNLQRKLPADAVVTSGIISIRAWASAANISAQSAILRIWLRKGGVRIGTDEEYLLSDHLPIAEPDGNAYNENLSVSGSLSWIGGQPWRAADINASNFGIQLYARNFAAGQQLVSVDHIRVTIFFNSATQDSRQGVLVKNTFNSVFGLLGD